MPAKPPTRTPPRIEVETFPDYQIITPPNRLRTAVRRVGDKSDDPVARAEKALAGLSDQFDEWMRHECERLTTAFGAIASGKFSAAERTEFYRAAHDIKGDAATFGYPAAGEIAESLCRVLELVPDLTAKARELLRHHVQAIEAIMRENRRRGLTATAGQLSIQLKEAAERFLGSAGEQAGPVDARQSPSIVPDS
jgi:chemotaxis protein histidine kinase CheA